MLQWFATIITRLDPWGHARTTARGLLLLPHHPVIVTEHQDSNFRFQIINLHPTDEISTCNPLDDGSTQLIFQAIPGPAAHFFFGARSY